MARLVRRWAVTACLASGSLASAQPWPPVTVDQGSPPPAPRFEAGKPPTDDPLFVIRTAGQADRTVRVVHPAKEADGLAEVKDTVTGQTFVIPGKVLAKLPRANAVKPEPAPTPTSPAEPKPQLTTPAEQLPQLPHTVVRPTRAELPTVTLPAPQPVQVPPQLGEKMVVTWRADTPAPTPSLTKPAPTTTPGDPWQAAGPEKPPVAPPPQLVPVPTWKPSVAPKPKTDPNDPWRPSGG